MEQQAAPDQQRRNAERRRLWDRRAPDQRRAGINRRHGERRVRRMSVDNERRASERRAGDRRGAMDRRLTNSRRVGRRRRETPHPYTSEQMDALRASFAAPGQPRCPACGSRFTLGPGRRRGNDVARRVACLGCGRAAVVPNSRVARILVVGRRNAIRDALQSMLGNIGHEVVETDDTGVALLAYQTIPADVVVLDVAAPGRLDAPAFLRRLRQVYPDARVVAVAGRSSHTGIDPLAVTQGLGAVKTARVPLAADELVRLIDEARA